MRATFPELADWERDFGSLIRGAKAALRPAAEAGPMFVRPAGGVSVLPKALGERLGPERLRMHTRATAIVADGAGYLVRAGDDGFAADAVVVATPSYVAAELLGAHAPSVLREIPYVGTSVVLLVYPEGTADALPDATGFVVPAGAAPMTAATFLSRKWPEPRFGDRAVVRCFVGAAGSEDVLEASDDDIVQAVCVHLAAVLPLPERAEASRVVRWPRSMPQYAVGHLDRVRAIEEALPPGIFVAGNAYHGVGCRRRRAQRERGGRPGPHAPRGPADRNGEGPMSESIYALYPCFKATRAFHELDADDAAREVEHLFKGWDGEVSVRGTYSTVGFRADTDLMLWLVGASPDAMQDALVAFGRTQAGRELERTWSFMGVVKPAEFTADHAPAFVKGEPPKRYACVYPFVRTPGVVPAPARGARRRCSANTARSGASSPTCSPTRRARSGSTTGSGSSRSRRTSSTGSSTASAVSARPPPAGTRRKRCRS